MSAPSITDYDILDLFRGFIFTEAERDPDMRALLLQASETGALRAKLAESLNLLPYQDLEKLFSDFIQEQFDAQLQIFFSRLKRIMHKFLRDTLEARLERLEQTILDLKHSTLMAAVHPYGWMQHEVTRLALEFLRQEPSNKATLHEIFSYLADHNIPLPGVTRAQKYQFVLELLRKIPEIAEYDGMLIELRQYETRKEAETLATAHDYRESVLLPAFRQMVERAHQIQNRTAQAD